ncbi:MAG: NADH-quinone oxidoreductase subunit B [Syntrophomonadaceae bacterium]|nr:NADH-quinone oxidoreductase subunit B [Syntrophomonadaceae bacterium]
MVLENNEVQLLEKNNIIFSNLEKLWNWGRARSFWPLSYGCNCCPIEMMAAGAGRFDIARYGYEVFRASPRQADLLIIAGPVTLKMKPVLQRLYAQMPEPKWVVAMGNCATAGGPYRDGYSVLPGCDTILPVDVYLPGCPPRPEALFHALLELKKKVEKGESHDKGTQPGSQM